MDRFDVIFDAEKWRFYLKSAKSNFPMDKQAIIRLNWKDMQKFGSVVDIQKSDWWRENFYMCAVCNRWLNGLCLKHPLIFIKEKTPKNIPFTVFDTFPPFFYLANSTIPGAGKGVFTKMDLPCGVAFGPYTGVINAGNMSSCSGYSWQIYKCESMAHHIWVDAVDFKYSNWMRYSNSARYCQEQNMVGYQYGHHMFYYTFKPIRAHSEILVWYGVDYGKSLKVPKAEKAHGYKAPIRKFPGIQNLENL